MVTLYISRQNWLGTKGLILTLASLSLTLGPIAARLGEVIAQARVGHGAVGEGPSAGEHLQLHGR